MTVYYLNKDHISASDANAGTSSSAPWLTLNKANTTIGAGDKVIVTGAYNEKIIPTNDGSIGSLIEYEAGEGGWTVDRNAGAGCADISSKNYVRINGPHLTNATIAVEANLAANCELINAEVDEIDSVTTPLNFNNTTDCLIDNIHEHDCLLLTAALRVKDSTNLTLSNSHIHAIGGDLVNGDVTNMLIEWCTLHSFVSGAGHEDLIVFENAAGAIIRYCKMWDFTQLIYQASQGSQSVWSDIEIYGNVMFTHEYGKPDFDGDGAPAIFCDKNVGGGAIVTNLWIYFNTFGYCGPKAVAVDVVDTSSGIIVRNNLFHQVRGTNAYDNIEVLVNDIAAGDIDYNAYSGPANAGPDSNVVTGNPISPLCVDYTYNDGNRDPLSYDFKLQSGSPCINAGDPALTTSGITVPATLYDLNRAVRDQNGGDIGAYEYAAITPATTSSSRRKKIFGGTYI